ncbi:AbiV family abortive infection protein [Chloroflexota bacterium]
MQMKDFISKFNGKPIDKKQIANGMHLCYKNAKSLRDEALLLKENGYKARALSLTILGLEEMGKIPLILNMILLLEKDDEAWHKPWKKLLSHKTKIGVMTAYGRGMLRMTGHGFKVELPPNIEPLLDKFKQLGFYVSFFYDQFIYPQDFVKDNHKWLEYLLNTLDERIDRMAGLHSSLEASIRFTDKAVDLLTTVKKARTESEMKKMINNWILQHTNKKND